MVCGAKRIWSLYLPWMTGVTPKLSTTAPPKGLASLFTINAATMRRCRLARLRRGRPPCLAPSVVAAGGSCIMRATVRRGPAVALLARRSRGLDDPSYSVYLTVQARRSGAVWDLLRWHEGCMDFRCNVIKRVLRRGTEPESSAKGET